MLGWVSAEQLQGRRVVTSNQRGVSSWREAAVTRRQVTGIFSRRTRRGATLRWDPEGRSRRRRRRPPTCGPFPSSCLLPSRRSTAPACPGRRCARSWRTGQTWFVSETEGFLLSDTQRGKKLSGYQNKKD